MDNPAADLAGFNLDQWIETGTTANEQVVIYANRALAGEYTALERRLAALEDAGDESIENGAEQAALLRKMEDLYERWQASKATWTVRALSDEEVRAVYDKHPTPKAPQKPADDAPAEVKQAWQGAMEMHLRALTLATDERNLAYVEAAVTRVETTLGAVAVVTIDQLRRMRNRPHGSQDLNRLIEAVNRVTQGDVEVPRPTSPGSSRSARA